MVLSSGRDITSEVEAQQELADSLETQRAILDAVVDSIITIDDNFRVLDVSPGTERIYGVSQVERRGSSSLNIVLSEDRAHVANETPATLPGRRRLDHQVPLPGPPSRWSDAEHRNARAPHS